MSHHFTVVGPVNERHRDARRMRAAARELRRDLEQKKIDPQEAIRLYSAYCPDIDSEEFVSRALQMFPYLGCGMATLLLRERLGEGAVIQGSYGMYAHTFLKCRGLVVDITADQFGGPKVHVARIAKPWSLRRVLTGFEGIPYAIDGTEPTTGKASNARRAIPLKLAFSFV